jgi:hypothetical protein
MHQEGDRDNDDLVHFSTLDRTARRSSSSLHDSVSGSGSGLSTSGSGARSNNNPSSANNNNGNNGQSGGGKGAALQGTVQPTPLNHSRSASLPQSLWKHTFSS